MMSKEEKRAGFGVFKGLTPEEMKASDNIVLDTLKAAAKEDSVGGNLIAHGLQMTGSEGEAFKVAVEAYSSACNPIFEKVLEHMSDENFRSQVQARLMQIHGIKKKGS